MEVQEIKIDGVTYVPFGEKSYCCKGCAFCSKPCTVNPYGLSVCEIFNHRRIKVKDDNTED